jgi:hypothetical protein
VWPRRTGFPQPPSAVISTVGLPFRVPFSTLNISSCVELEVPHQQVHTWKRLPTWRVVRDSPFRDVDVCHPHKPGDVCCQNFVLYTSKSPILKHPAGTETQSTAHPNPNPKHSTSTPRPRHLLTRTSPNSCCIARRYATSICDKAVYAVYCQNSVKFACKVRGDEKQTVFSCNFLHFPVFSCISLHFLVFSSIPQ